jgi:hypothetical protein
MNSLGENDYDSLEDEMSSFETEETMTAFNKNIKQMENIDEESSDDEESDTENVKEERESEDRNYNKTFLQIIFLLFIIWNLLRMSTDDEL